MRIGELLRRAAEALFPPKCPFCGRTLSPGEALCGECLRALPEEIDQREYPLAGGETLSVRSAFPYAGRYREAMHRYKFEGRRGYCRAFARLMVRALGDDAPFDGVVYVPLTARDKRRRGYDQSALLARETGRLLGLPVLEGLQKCRCTATQHELSREAREENVRGAFAASAAVGGQRLLLIDDIVTTGATLRAAADALYKAGARQVQALCAAGTKGPENAT